MIFEQQYDRSQIEFHTIHEDDLDIQSHIHLWRHYMYFLIHK